MLCGWGVKAGKACLQVKLCVAISERFTKCILYLKALYIYKCPRFSMRALGREIEKYSWQSFTIFISVVRKRFIKKSINDEI